MTKTFTKNDVLRYFYNEVSRTKKHEIEEFLSCNKIMQDYYCDLLDTDKRISKTFEQPKRSTIDNILDYSKSLCLHN